MRTIDGDLPSVSNGFQSSPTAHEPGVDDYNAALVGLNRVHEGLAILRVSPDGESLVFEPGQYTVLGLHESGDSERPMLSAGEVQPMIRRAYSFSCSLLDSDGRLRPPNDFTYREFYVALVAPHGERPTLTPLLFRLLPGARLFVGRHAKGEYTLHGIGPTDSVVFIGTGTGEAPHNAMLAELFSRGHAARIVVATCVRYAADLAYLHVHRELERRHSNYRYLPLATREAPCPKTESSRVVCGCHLQDYLLSGNLERDAGLQLDPAHTHIFLCGNPAMIGLPQHLSSGKWQFPQPPGMIELLTARGFTLDRPHARGNIHVERYW